MRVFEDLDPSKDDVVFVGYSSAEHGQCVVEQRRRRDVDPTLAGGSAPMESRQVYLDPTTNDFASPLAVLLRREAGAAIPPMPSNILPGEFSPPPASSSWSERIGESPASMGLLGALLLGSGFLVGRRIGRAPRLGKVGVTDAVWSRRMDDLERRLVNQVQSANRDRTREIDTFKREILSSLSTHATAGTVIGIENEIEHLAGQIEEVKEASQKDFGKVLAQIEASNRDRRTEFHGFRSEIMGQLQSQDVAEVEARLNERMDTLSDDIWEWSQEHHGSSTGGAAGAPLKSEGDAPTSASGIESFRTELMEQLERMEHTQKKLAAQSPSPPKVDAASVPSAAPIAPYMDEARLGQVLRSAIEEVIDAKIVKPAALLQPESSTKGAEPFIPPQFDEAGVVQALRSAVEDVQSAKGTAKPPVSDDADPVIDQQTEGFQSTYCMRGPAASETSNVRAEVFIPEPSSNQSTEELANTLRHSRFTHQLQRLFDHLFPQGTMDFGVEVPLPNMGTGPLITFDLLDQDQLTHCLKRAEILLQVARGIPNPRSWMEYDGVCAPNELHLAKRVNEVLVNLEEMDWEIRDGMIPGWAALEELERVFDATDLAELQSSAHGIPKHLEFREKIADGRSRGMIIRYDAVRE